MLLSPMPEIDKISRDDVEHVASAWWLLLVVGVLTVIAGIVILEVDWTVKSLATFVGVVFIVRGLFDAVTPPVDGAPRSWSFVSGAANIVIGIIALVWPGPTLLVIAILIGLWLLFSGIFDIVGAVANHRTLPLWGLTLAVGVLSTGLGIWALRRPGQTLAVVVVLVGIWAIVVGLLGIVAAFEVKRLPETFDRVMRSA